MRHELGRIDYAPALVTNIPEFKVDEGIRANILLQLETVSAISSPKLNDYNVVQFEVAVNDTQEFDIAALCIPRAYRPKPDERLKWTCAIVMEYQFSELRALPPDEISSRLVGFLGLSGDDARHYTKVY
jgi:hypothetical protein